MGTLKHWSHGHFWTGEPVHVHWTPQQEGIVNGLKGTWLVVLLVLLTLFCVITAVLLAWPLLAHLAAWLFV